MDEDLVKGEEVNSAEQWGEADGLAPGHEASIYTQSVDTVSTTAGQTGTGYTQLLQPGIRGVCKDVR